MRKLNKIKVC